MMMVQKKSRLNTVKKYIWAGNVVSGYFDKIITFVQFCCHYYWHKVLDVSYQQAPLIISHSSKHISYYSKTCLESPLDIQI